jgi:4-aminobutyrate aminotransferase-like enzyme
VEPSALELLARIVGQRRDDAVIYLPGERWFVTGRAEGCLVYDELGAAFLDFGSGGAVNLLGHCHPELRRTLEHFRFYTYTGDDHIARFSVEYAKALSEKFPPDADGQPRQVLVTASLEQADAIARSIPGSLGSEVTTGFGRTGAMWGFEHYGLPCPDVVVLGTSGGGGLPFAAVVATASSFATASLPPMVSHPVTSAMALMVLQGITDELLTHVRTVSGVLSDGLAELTQQFPAILSGANGVGLTQQLFTTEQVDKNKFRDACRAAGLFMHPDLTLTPPLVVTEQEVRQAIDVIADIALDWS